MDYNEYNDEELVSMISESDDTAKDIIYEKYYYIIDFCIRDFKKQAYALGIDYRDLYQEAMLGFADALQNYEQYKSANLKTFINLCVVRRLVNLMKKARSEKNKAMKDALSLDYYYEDTESTLAEVLSDEGKNNPLLKLTTKEDYKALIDELDKVLAEKEKEVFILLINDKDIKTIAQLLGRDAKSVYNSIQRIKTKTKEILNRREIE